jgi:hypothetical protein
LVLNQGEFHHVPREGNAVQVGLILSSDFATIAFISSTFTRRSCVSVSAANTAASQERRLDVETFGSREWLHWARAGDVATVFHAVCTKRHTFTAL